MKGILNGEGDDWPTDFYHGFDEPMAVTTANLSEAECWDLPVSWAEALGWLDGC